jgi:hypothetical protein
MASGNAGIFRAGSFWNKLLSRINGSAQSIELSLGLQQIMKQSGLLSRGEVTPALIVLAELPRNYLNDFLTMRALAPLRPQC